MGVPAELLAAPAGRRLFGLERLWLAADRSWPPFVNQLVVEGEGEADPDALLRALPALAAAWPAARARLQGRLGGCRWVADGRPPAVREGGDWDGVSPHPALSARLDPACGPIVEVVRFTGRIVVRTHHAAFDGRAAWPLAVDLGRALRGEPLEGATFSGVEEPPAPGPRPPAPPADSPLAVPGRPGGGAEPRWALRSLPAAPRHAVVRIALGLAAARGERVRVSVPVDLRPAPRPAVAANLTGFVRLDVLLDEDVAAVAARLRAAVHSPEPHASLHAADGLHVWPVWLLAALASASASAQLRARRVPGTASISNLGLQDAAVLDHAGFRGRALYWLPPANPGSGAFITLTGHAGGLELVVGLPAGLAEGGRLDALAGVLAASLSATAGADAAVPR